ncbi:MAG: cytochrome c oxidase subunit II [Solirubrobacteraceae bacterium]
MERTHSTHGRTAASHEQHAAPATREQHAAPATRASRRAYRLWAILRGQRARRRLAGLLLSPIIAYGTMLAAAPSAFAFFAPVSPASPNAESIDSLYKIVLYIALVVFVVVEGALGYALWRFRASRNKVAEQTHGNTRLELAWTLGAVAIVIALATVTLLELGAIDNPQNTSPNGAKLAAQSGVLYASSEKRLPPSRKYLEVEVIGRQFVWEYVYGGQKAGFGAPYSYEEMVVPTHTTVVINVVSVDVIHGWWIPALGGKLQAVPGYHNYGWFKIDKPGVYRGQCANLCGRGHARMIAAVRAVPPAQYEEWVAKRAQEIREANIEAGKMKEKLEREEGTGKVLNP